MVAVALFAVFLVGVAAYVLVARLAAEEARRGQQKEVVPQLGQKANPISVEVFPHAKG